MGIARRLSNGSYTVREGISVAFTTDTATCASENIQRIPDGTWIEISPSAAAPSGYLFFLYQTVAFRFSGSSDLPGRIGLWRRVNNGAYEELVAPFDSTARFRFLVGANPVPTDIAPADLSTVAGLELVLAAQSYEMPQGKSSYATFELPTQLQFLNRAN
jgi:hypothetical protein